jgi:hypothetical protein
MTQPNSQTALLPMYEAPRDGRVIRIRFEHDNYKYAQSDEEKKQWEEICQARWINNCGSEGWTWTGLCGRPTGWLPLEAA